MISYANLDPVECDYVEIGEESDLPEGERLFVEIDDLKLVIFNIAGQLFAIADVCSHDDGPLGDGEVDGFQVVCPRHGARFDVQTGKALTLPAFIDIPSYPVRRIAGKIEVGIPKQR